MVIATPAPVLWMMQKGGLEVTEGEEGPPNANKIIRVARCKAISFVMNYAGDLERVMIYLG